MQANRPTVNPQESDGLVNLHVGTRPVVIKSTAPCDGGRLTLRYMVQLGIADHAGVKDRDQGYDVQPQPIKFCMVGLFADAYYNERVKQMYKSGYLTEPDADRQLTAAEDNLFGAVVRNYCHVGYEYCSPFENG